ncbi:hypothetical protein Vafri_3059 [Volvox africanus]|uniref:Uncharacterized protein n=1 Tax=Volvox africanus TaxID=51714 RepID=A0A8J4ASD9_9CHLO|nr:hypothetical protein Vafri_3059 [Volvox africanus]
MLCTRAGPGLQALLFCREKPSLTTILSVPCMQATGPRPLSLPCAPLDAPHFNIQVALLQDGHKMFTEIEATDRKSSGGSIAIGSMEQYLVTKHNMREADAKTLSMEIFKEMQVGQMAPASFLSFIKVYPTLREKLDDLMSGQRDSKRARRGH